MAETADSRWHRGSYPLQTTIKTFTPATSIMSGTSPERAGNTGSASARKIKSVSPERVSSALPHSQDAVNDIIKYSIMSQLGGDATFALRKSIDDILASSEAPAVVPGASSTASPTSSSHSHHPPSMKSNASENTTIQSDAVGQPSAATSSRAWARNRYPLQAMADDRPDESEDALEQSQPTQKMLRRAPGVDQLRVGMSGIEERSVHAAPAPSSSSDSETTPVPEPGDTTHSTPGWSAGRWKRQRYPSQNPSLSGYSHQSLDSSRQSAGFASNSVSPSSPTKEEQNAAREILACPVSHQPAVRPSEQHPPRSPGDKAASTSITAPPTDRDRGRSRTKSSFSRQAYPLQTPASTTDLRGMPSSPPLSVKTDPPEATDAAKPQQRTNQLKRSRRPYPLHSPPSIVQLNAPPSPPSSSEGELEASFAAPESLRAEEPSQRQKKRFYRRSGYPLQNSASFAELKPSAKTMPTLAENTPHQIAHESAKTSEEPPQTQEQYSRFRQRGYPLQPRSGPGPKLFTSLQPLPLEIKTEQPDQNISDSLGESPTATSRGKYQKRKGYPLASQPSVPALKFSPPTPPSESEAPALAPAVAPAAAQADISPSSKEELATKVLKQWRRPVYPMQDTESLLRRTLTPKPSQESVGRSPSPGPRFLPKNLRAVKDSTAPSQHGRTIIVCLDGTGDKFDNDNSNIVHLVSSLKKDDPSQVSYYQAGIGTYNEGGLNTGFSAAMDMAVGSELGLHVRDAYQFLMHSYKEGDKICIFGFSRGAYTARCLAGMVHKVGLLPPRNLQQIYFAYQFYADDSTQGWDSSSDFKATFSIDVSVYFLGCFDSVASVGIIPRQLPLSTTPSNKCQFFRHAMALDERRAKFKVCRYQTVEWDDIQIGMSSTETKGDGSGHEKYGPNYHPNVTDEEYERLEEADLAYETDVKEVWFVGCHADVGGGAVPNTERHKLAQIPLRWMIRQAFECNTGIRFKTKKLAEFGIDVHTLWPQYRGLSAPAHGPPPSFLEKYEKGLPPRSVRRGKLIPTERFDQGERLYHLKSHKDEDWTPEQTEDFFDAMAPMNDQLVQALNWWILEFWPVQYKVPVAPGKIEMRTGMNLGRYRAVGDVEPNLHWTVLQRMHHLGYKIQVRMAPHTKWKIAV